MELLRLKQWTGKVVLSCDMISKVIQSEGRLSQEPNLFVLHALVRTETQGKSYDVNEAPLVVDPAEYPESTSIKIQVIHGYDPEEAVETIVGNLPSMAASRGNFKDLMKSEELAKIEEKTPDNIINSNGNITLGMRCFYYFGRAMELELYNSLVAPTPIEDYLKYLPVIENRAICKGIILGQLWTYCWM